MPANTTAPSRKKKGRRTRLIVIVLALALVGGVAFGTYWSISTVRASFPQTTGSLRLEGLGNSVDVKRDAHGIPQIYADTDADLFMAQGYVQAQDRFWEMDVRRHTTAGRLSEMFGKDLVKTDSFLRTLGWRETAQKEYDELLSPETKRNLQAYSKGVNAYLQGKEGKDISVEYAALNLTNDYAPQDWTPVDSVAWLKAMAWDLRGNMQDEIDRSLMHSRLSEKQIAQLYPEYPFDKNKPIIRNGAVDAAGKTFDPKGTSTGGSSTADGSGTGTGTEETGTGTGAGTAAAGPGTGTVTDGAAGTAGAAETGAQGDLESAGAQTQLAGVADALDEVPELLGPNGTGIGSNSWVVAGKYTTTGKPLLANDPHLAPQLPSLWYQMGLHCRSLSAKCSYDVSGYTFSGMPGVVIGHNQEIAWGLTNLGADVTDLYLEKLQGDGYEYDGKERAFETREEVIKVAGGASRTITVRSTDNGPVLSDRSDELKDVGKEAPVGASAPDRGDGYAVSLRWTALEPGKTMEAVFALNRAKDFQEFKAAAKDFEVPSQNLVYADRAGNIGYQAPGRIPVRAKGVDGTTPQPGWDSDYRWKGWIPEDALPWEYNPKRGYIVTANQAVIDEDEYPYLLTKDWGYGARSQRINDLIQSKIDDGVLISTEDMRTMQMDNASDIAKTLKPLLLKIDVDDPKIREAQKLLEGWDGSQDSDSPGAAYFNAVWSNILKLAFGNKLPKELRADGDCISVPPADPQQLLDNPDKRVRECGERDSGSAQPDGGDRWYEVVRSILDDADSPWWQAPGKHRNDDPATNRDELFERAMEDARWELTAKLGNDIDTWSWGRLHRLTLTHQTLGKSGPGALQWLLNRGPWNLGGGEAAVDATGWNAATGYEVIWVPSMRMVVNLADFDKSQWINLTGASGHAYSPHYTDQTDKWAAGELLPWPYTEQAVKKSVDEDGDSMVLRP
ncbi:penicillin acylase family protein [Streptomyces sp. NPDC060194]|uniref:penicillin acylase family protein n=1 Tax=Streptomyces sp. NPDC060194 TaxID=3347069 RepID=UPI00365903A1